MNEVPPFSPGCFGSALAFKEGDSICRGCVFAPQCKPVHEHARAALRARFGITTVEERQSEKEAHKAATVTARQQRLAGQDAGTMSLPKKVRELIDRLDTGNYQVTTKLKNGENPFGASMQFMKIACHILLKGYSPDRALLAAGFVKALNWQKGTAEAHARMAIQALTHIGAVDNIDGRITLRRD